jgi:hypothetical protein
MYPSPGFLYGGSTVAKKDTELVRVSREVFDQLGDPKIRMTVERETHKVFAGRGDILAYCFQLGLKQLVPDDPKIGGPRAEP